MAADEWHYSQQGQQVGPISETELKARISRGEIRLTDLVWTPSMSQWQPVSEVGALNPKNVPPPLPAVDQSIPFAQRATFGQMYPPPSSDLGENAGMRMLIPVGRSGWAIAAGYLGLFSVLLLPAPIALAVSIMAIRDIKKNPKTYGMGRAVFGLIMGILGTVAFAILLVTAFLK